MLANALTPWDKALPDKDESSSDGDECVRQETGHETDGKDEPCKPHQNTDDPVWPALDIIERLINFRNSIRKARQATSIADASDDDQNDVAVKSKYHGYTEDECWWLAACCEMETAITCDQGECEYASDLDEIDDEEEQDEEREGRSSGLKAGDLVEIRVTNAHGRKYFKALDVAVTEFKCVARARYDERKSVQGYDASLLDDDDNGEPRSFEEARVEQRNRSRSAVVINDVPQMFTSVSTDVGITDMCVDCEWDQDHPSEPHPSEGHVAVSEHHLRDDAKDFSFEEIRMCRVPTHGYEAFVAHMDVDYTHGNRYQTIEQIMPALECVDDRIDRVEFEKEQRAWTDGVMTAADVGLTCRPYLSYDEEFIYRCRATYVTNLATRLKPPAKVCALWNHYRMRCARGQNADQIKQLLRRDVVAEENEEERIASLAFIISVINTDIDFQKSESVDKGERDAAALSRQLFQAADRSTSAAVSVPFETCSSSRKLFDSLAEDDPFDIPSDPETSPHRAGSPTTSSGDSSDAEDESLWLPGTKLNQLGHKQLLIINKATRVVERRLADDRTDADSSWNPHQSCDGWSVGAMRRHLKQHHADEYPDLVLNNMTKEDLMFDIDPPKQWVALVQGAPGTGKTETQKWTRYRMKLHADMYGVDGIYTHGAYMGVSASLNNGSTLHSLLPRISSTKDKTSDEIERLAQRGTNRVSKSEMRPMTQAERVTALRVHENCICFTLDEYQSTSAGLLGRCHTRLQQVHASNSTVKWPNLNCVILFGDAFQLQRDVALIKAHSPAEATAGTQDTYTIVGLALFREIEARNMFNMNTLHRANGCDVMQKHTTDIRTKLKPFADTTRLETIPPFKSSDASDNSQLLGGYTIIGFVHEELIPINHSLMVEHSMSTGCPHITWSVPFRGFDLIPDDLVSKIRRRYPQLTAHFVKGFPVQMSYNVNTKHRLCNGTQGYLHGMGIYDHNKNRELHAHVATNQSNGTVKLPDELVPDFVVLKLANQNHKIPARFRYQDQNTDPEFTYVSYAIDHGRNMRKSVKLKHRDSPVTTVLSHKPCGYTLAAAITVDKSLGGEYKRVILDLQKRSGSISRKAAHSLQKLNVMTTRVRRWADLRLMPSHPIRNGKPVMDHLSRLAPSNELLAFVRHLNLPHQHNGNIQ